MSDIFETAIVEKRNVLNELRSNNMTLQELRFFSIYLSKINPWDISTRVVRFPLSDFQRIMGFGRLNIRQLKSCTDSLLCKIVHVPDKKGGYTAFQLFKRCRVSQNDNGEWYVEIDAHDDALSLMFEFKNRYFKYRLWNALRLKSPNQIRMYEILKQYEHIGKRELTITELRELLGIGSNEYADRTGWSNFKKYVLDSCRQALKENTDICFTYERGKTGKGGKWLTIIFLIKKNAEYKDPLSLDEFLEQQPKREPALDSIGDNGEFVGQTSMLDTYAEASNPLAAAVDYELDCETIRLIAEMIRNKGVEDYDVPKILRELWLRLLCEDTLKTDNGMNPIRNKAKYLIRMIDNREPPTKKRADDSTSTISMDRYYELVNSFNPWDLLDEKD